MQGLPRASLKSQADGQHQKQPSVSQLTESMRNSIGFGVPHTASASDVHNGSFESIGSHFGSRMHPSHPNSHDSETGGSRTGLSLTSRHLSKRPDLEFLLLSCTDTIMPMTIA